MDEDPAWLSVGSHRSSNHPNLKKKMMIGQRLLQGRHSVIYISCIIIYQIFLLARDWSKQVTLPNIPQVKWGNIQEYSSIFKILHVVKRTWRIINTRATIRGRNVLGYFSWTLSVPHSPKFSSSYALRILLPFQNR